MLLVSVVVGSGIAAERLSPADVGSQLLVNSIATGAGLVALIAAFAGVSGAHLNPAVTLAVCFRSGIPARIAAAYVAVQIAAACAGAVLTNLMFELDPITVSTRDRASPGLWLGEVLATFGLVVVITGVVRSGRLALVPFAVAGYITAGYWFTSSTSFANPAVTVARTLTDTFTGIAPASAVGFAIAQLAGCALAAAFVAYLHPPLSNEVPT